MLSLQDLTYAELQKEVTDRGFPIFRAKQLLEMSTQYKRWEEVSNLPSDLIESFKKDYLDTSLALLGFVTGQDKTKKYLFKTHDDHLIESVYLVNSYGCTVCISTQIGCRMGCSFCASGKYGLERNLTAGEMLSQVLSINRLNKTKDRRGIANIVLMGSGEPLDNYENVEKFLKLVSSEDGINISRRNITISTCGLADKIIMLANSNLGINLSISLHSSSDDERKKIMPVSKKFGIADILSASEYYFDKTGRRVTYEYALIPGKNSSETDAHALGSLLAEKSAHVNLIKANPIDGNEHIHIENKDIVKFMKIVSSYGVNITLRKSLGEDIEGACGQLKRKYLGDNVALEQLKPCY